MTPIRRRIDAEMGSPRVSAQRAIRSRIAMETVEQIAVCPACRGPLGRFRCDPCDTAYPVVGDQADLRPRSRISRTIQFDLEPPGENRPALVAPLRGGPWPAIPFPLTGQFAGGNRLSRELTTYLPPGEPGDLLLDLGCGERRLGAHLAEWRGYEYLGVDLAGEAPSVLADAHALPFADGSIAACCTFAVLEHSRMPHLFALELARVLRAGGTLLGTVAFLEPYHGRSYFHHTHLGVLEVLENAGFEQVLVEANDAWFATDALFRMYTAERLPLGRYVTPVVAPLLRLLSGSTRVAMRRHPETLRRITGGFRFVARAPGSR